MFIQKEKLRPAPPPLEGPQPKEKSNRQAQMNVPNRMLMASSCHDRRQKYEPSGPDNEVTGF